MAISGENVDGQRKTDGRMERVILGVPLRSCPGSQGHRVTGSKTWRAEGECPGDEAILLYKDGPQPIFPTNSTIKR